MDGKDRESEMHLATIKKCKNTNIEEHKNTKIQKAKIGEN